MYNSTSRSIHTFPCRAVMVRITLTPQFCAKVRGMASKARAAASYGHCYTTNKHTRDKKIKKITKTKLINAMHASIKHLFYAFNR